MNLAITVAGTVYSLPVFAAYGIGSSALSVYQDIYGTISSGTSADYLNTYTSYDKLIKYTYVGTSQNAKSYGCTSYKAWINTTYMDQYYAQKGQRNATSTYQNKTYFSSSFESSIKKAIQYYPSGGTSDAYIYFSALGKNKTAL